MPAELPFQVIWSRQATDAAKVLAKKALKAGRAKELARIIRGINKRLTEPLDFGEVYRVKGAVEERLAVQAYLSINFAVDIKRKLVLVRNCRALSGQGL